MKRRDAVLALGAAGVIVLALMTVFALELSNTQAKSKQDVRNRVHERAVLATALIDSLFQSVQQQVPQNARRYGGRTISPQLLEAAQQENRYVAILDSSEHVLAASSGFTAQARANLGHSAALALIRKGHPFGLGNVLPYGNQSVINFAVVFPTRYGRRIMISGFAPSVLSQFIKGELDKIPGVRGAHNYLIDGHRAVIASTNPAIKPGQVLNSSRQVKALSKSSGDVNDHYFDQVGLSHSTWRVVLSAPNGPLFASVSGLRKWVPWFIFAAFALVALSALALGRRTLRSADQVREANAQLESVNDELATTNATLERRAAELARSNSELEQFASIASHDLQEPLRKVRTFTQQLAEHESEHLSDKGHDYIARANAAAERMQKLIEDLLRFSRVATHGRAFVPVDLETLTREVIGDLEAQVENAGAEVTVGPLPTVNGDALQLRQLVQNLISNALKFRRDDVETKIEISGEIVDGMARISVRDNGIGFEPQYSLRIFRIFERLHGRSAYPGTGIGLALSRKIVERHGGDIVAESVPGAGSTFIVTMPANQSEEVVVVSHHLQDDAEPATDNVPAAV